jgi:hypothetical protein
MYKVHMQRTWLVELDNVAQSSLYLKCASIYATMETDTLKIYDLSQKLSVGFVWD